MMMRSHGYVKQLNKLPQRVANHMQIQTHYVNPVTVTNDLAS